MARRVSNASEFFDILSSMKGGVFATIGYVTGANLALPQVKRKNPLTNRMKGYDDYESFGKSIGYEGDIKGIIKLTSYTLNWSTPDSITKAYKKYKTSVNDINAEFGLEPIKSRGDYKSKQDFGKNGVAIYSGDNEDLNGHSYTAQNINGARIKSMYYLINNDGRVTNELNKEQVVNFLKKRPEVTGVAALRKMGTSEERIQEYINKVTSLGMSYKNFEASSILYMVATVNGEKIIYINDNLNHSVEEVNVSTADLTSIAKERYKEDLITLQESIQNFERNQMLNEIGIQSLIWFD